MFCEGTLFFWPFDCFYLFRRISFKMRFVLFLQGGSAQTDMEVLERQADKIRAAKAQGAAVAAAAGGAEANPEEIDLDMDLEVTNH